MTDEHSSDSPADEQAPPPPPPPVVEPTGGSTGGDNRMLMVILSYLYFFCLVPLFVEKDDKEVQWHAKHGLILLGADLLLAVAFTVLSVGVIGCLLAPVWALLHFALFVVRIVAIVKGNQGERLILPGISSFADKF